MIYSILEYFFPGEDFVPEEDFVLCIFSPLILTFRCGNDYMSEDFVLEGFCPGRILSQEYFALYLSIYFNGYFDDLWYFRVFFPREDFVLCIFSP